jgi:hypothetical protein
VDGLLRENSEKLGMDVICNMTFGKVRRERERERDQGFKMSIVLTSTLLLLLLLLLLLFTAIEFSLQTKQIRINIHKRINAKALHKKIQSTVKASTHIAKTPTHTHTHTLQNKLKQPQYTIHTK